MRPSPRALARALTLPLVASGERDLAVGLQALEDELANASQDGGSGSGLFGWGRGKKGGSGEDDYSVNPLWLDDDEDEDESERRI